MSYNTGPKIVTDGLVLCLDAADRNSYPGSGSTWYDQSGNGNNGTLTNGPTFSSNNRGSIVFDGTNDYVQGQNYQITDYATINVWVNTTQTADIRPIFDINTILNGGGLAIGWRSGTGVGTASVSWRDDAWSTGAYPYITSTTNTRDGNWHMLTAVYDSVGAKLYIDSILEASSTRNSTLTQVGGQFIRIGLLGNQTTTYYYSGKLALSQLYNRALSADEVRRNYNATKGRFGL